MSLRECPNFRSRKLLGSIRNYQILLYKSSLLSWILLISHLWPYIDVGQLNITDHGDTRSHEDNKIYVGN